MKKQFNLAKLFLGCCLAFVLLTSQDSPCGSGGSMSGSSFWGYHTTRQCDYVVDGVAYRTSCKTYFVFWIAFGSEQCSTENIQ